jgi:hypothetical protein
MTHDDDAGEDLLAGLDLHKWRVPPPPSFQSETILVRALSPAPAAKRRSIGWLLAAIVALNALIATLIVIVASRAPEPRVAVLPAGPASDSQIKELMRRIDEDRRELERRLAEVDQERRELDRKLAELAELRSLTEQLADQMRKLDRDKHDRPAPKQPDPAPPTSIASCDEVSCVLDNYASPCCTKYRSPNLNPPPPALNQPPEMLDRAAISAGIAGVRDRIAACGVTNPVKGNVKVRVTVSSRGTVVRVVVDTTPDAALAQCVANQMQKAKFAATKLGGSFSYPFVF